MYTQFLQDLLVHSTFLFISLSWADATCVWNFRKKKAREEKLGSSNVVVVNEGFQGDNTPKTGNKGGKISYEPDPNLNLKPQTIPGTQEPGLRNGQPSDMQPYAMLPQKAASSLNDLNKEPSVEPNYPPLAGQGSQSSLTNPTPMTQREIDALYANVPKKQHAAAPPPQSQPPRQFGGSNPASRSSSANDLQHQPQQPPPHTYNQYADNEVYQSSNDDTFDSHGVSQGNVETDVWEYWLYHKVNVI